MKRPLIVLICCGLVFGGCSVGTKVTVNAPDVSYPVSQTSSFYAPNDELIAEGDYELLDTFSLTFRKWGVTGVINIKSEADISARLDEIIQEQGGDAIVDLKISVHSPNLNSFLWFTKVVAFMTAIIATPITLAEPSPTGAYVSSGSALVYLFTPAAADIKIDGRVVKLHSDN